MIYNSNINVDFSFLNLSLKALVITGLSTHTRSTPFTHSTVVPSPSELFSSACLLVYIKHGVAQIKG